MTLVFWLSTAFVVVGSGLAITSIIRGEMAFQEEVYKVMNANPTISKSEAEAVVRAWMGG